MFYKIFKSRDRNIRQSVATCRCEVLLSTSSASAVTVIAVVNNFMGFILAGVCYRDLAMGFID